MCDSTLTAEECNVCATMDPTDELVGLRMPSIYESATLRNRVSFEEARKWAVSIDKAHRKPKSV